MVAQKLVHIGLPRAGSTTLQQLLFAKHPDICEFIQPNWKYGETNTVLRTILDENYYHSKSLDILFRDKQSQYASIVISDEALTFGEFMSRSCFWKIKSDHYKIASQIKKIVGDAKILIVIRNQADLLKSLYQYQMGRKIKQKKLLLKDIHSFDSFLEVNERNSSGRFLKLFNYYDLFEAYTDIFGTEYVKVFIFELYQDCFYEIGNSIGLELGLDSNIGSQLINDRVTNKRSVSVSFYRWNLLPKIIKTLPKYNRIIPKGVQKKAKSILTYTEPLPNVSNSTYEMIRKEFADSNVKLFNYLGINGNHLGYW